MRNFLLLMLIIVSFVGYSKSIQSGENFEGGTIEGRVFDANSREKIEYANVVVLSPSDSSVITGTVTDSDGKFTIQKLNPGKYNVEVRFIGYNKKHFNIEINNNKPRVDLGDILIEPAAVNLQNVVVEGERSPVTYELDKKIIDVSKIETATSGNAADVLENVPSVTVDIDGNVSLRGSTNFTVLIDGRPSIMDAQDALQQIPASSIKSIELITNPSAKYDPEGTAGIINIVLKKNQNLGMSGIVNGNVGLNDKFGGDFLFEYKTENINANFGLDYNRRFSPGNGTAEQRFILGDNTSYLNSRSDLEWGRISSGLRGGIDFNFSDNDLLNIGGRYGSRKWQRNATENYVGWSQIDPTDSLYSSFGHRERSGNFYGFNFNYNHHFGNEGHELSSEFSLGHFSADELTTSSEINNNIQVSGKQTTETGPSTHFRGKIDYTLPLGENSKFESGAQGETHLSEDDTGLLEYNPLTNIYELQSQYSNKTKYNRKELAVYSILSDKISNFSVQGGLRGEYTYRTIEIKEQNQNFNIDRWDLFPSVHSSYKFSEGEQLMASYTRRIERPRGWELEPFLTWLDANNVRKGNPSLQPEFIDSYEFGFQTHIGGVSFSSEFYYRVTNNKVERINSVYDRDITLRTTENVGKDYSLGNEFMFILDPFEFWDVNLMGNLYNYKVTGVLLNESFDNQSFTWNTRFNNVFKISNSTQLSLNFRYNSPRVSAQDRREGFFSSDIALKQELFNKILTLTLQVRDVFKTRKFESTTESPDFYRHNYFNRESPRVMLTLRYNFNNYKDEHKEENSGNEFDQNGNIQQPQEQ